MTINEFAQSYFAYNRISDARRRLVLKNLIAFQDFVGGDIEQATPDHLRDWLGALLASGQHVNTVRLKGNIIRCFFNHAWNRGEIDAETLLRVRAVKNPRGATGDPTPRPYTKNEITALYAAIDARHKIDARGITTSRWLAGRAHYRRMYPHLMNLQYKAVVALALDCGLRRAEIYACRVEDIHPDNDMVVVRSGKSKISGEPRLRDVPFTVNARTAIAKWLEGRALISPAHDRVWCSLVPGLELRAHLIHGGVSAPNFPMNRDRFDSLLRILEPGYQYHRLRHTGATMWLRAGVPLEIVSKYLGHASIRQTLGYVQLIRNDLERHMQGAEAQFEVLVGRREAVA